MIDGIAYFTNGLCVPSGGLDGVSYSTLGLVISGGVPAYVPRGGVEDGYVYTRRDRQQFIRQAEEEAMFLQIIVMAVESIENDGR